MRKILRMLEEIRVLNLQQYNAPPQRIQEARDAFAHMDTMLSGINYDGPESALREVMTSADFENAIGDFLQRKIWAGYEEQTFAFEPLVEPDTLPNYLPVTRYLDQAGTDDLELVGFKAPARPGSIDDLTERQWQVYPWRKQWDLSHRALVNDDLGYFDRVVPKIGRAARRTLEKFVSRLYTNATSIAVWTGAGALYSTTGRLTTARISTARMAFRQRTNTRGERINANLNYVVHHTGLVDTVATIQRSTQVPENATNAANVVRNTFTPIEDPHMAGTAPNLPWYAFSDEIKPLVLARMSMVPGPMMVRKKSDVERITSLLGPGTAVAPIWGDFATGDIEIAIWDVWGTYVDETNGNLVDYHGGYYSSGTAP